MWSRRRTAYGGVDLRGSVDTWHKTQREQSGGGASGRAKEGAAPSRLNTRNATGVAEVMAHADSLDVHQIPRDIRRSAIFLRIRCPVWVHTIRRIDVLDTAFPRESQARGTHPREDLPRSRTKPRWLQLYLSPVSVTSERKSVVNPVHDKKYASLHRLSAPLEELPLSQKPELTLNHKVEFRIAGNVVTEQGRTSYSRGITARWCCSLELRLPTRLLYVSIGSLELSNFLVSRETEIEFVPTASARCATV